jgi:hypothetical protein
MATKLATGDKWRFKQRLNQFYECIPLCVISEIGSIIPDVRLQKYFLQARRTLPFNYYYEFRLGFILKLSPKQDVETHRYFLWCPNIIYI